MSGAPLISVVMPVRDGARYIAEALASIHAQGHAPLEQHAVKVHSDRHG